MSQTTSSRRRFLKIAGLSLVAATAACSGLGYAATLAPVFPTTDLNLGKDNPMNKRILVTYATRAGSTVEVAAAVGEVLAKRGFAVAVKPVKAKPSLDGYHAVVLGSAIRMGSWLPEIVNYIKQNQPALGAVPTAMFSVHMLNTGDDETSQAARLAYTASLHQLLVPTGEAFFAGKMDYAQLPLLDRLIAKAVEGATGASAGDRRDWNKIRGWTEGILA